MSILTRHHPGRPNSLKRCLESIDLQTDRDFDHLIFHDDKKGGIPSANRIFFERRNFVTGNYIFMLDDDDFLRAPDFVSDMRNISENCGLPDVIVIRMLMENVVYPKMSVWGSGSVLPGTIGTSCIVTSNRLWHTCVDEFRTTDTPGDFNFINSIFSKVPTIQWRDKVYVEVPQLSWGRPE
jgi:hypothetical protein